MVRLRSAVLAAFREVCPWTRAVRSSIAVDLSLELADMDEGGPTVANDINRLLYKIERCISDDVFQATETP